MKKQNPISGFMKRHKVWSGIIITFIVLNVLSVLGTSGLWDLETSDRPISTQRPIQQSTQEDVIIGLMKRTLLNNDEGIDYRIHGINIIDLLKTGNNKVLALSYESDSPFELHYGYAFGTSVAAAYYDNSIGSVGIEIRNNGAVETITVLEGNDLQNFRHEYSSAITAQQQETVIGKYLLISLDNSVILN